MANQNPKHFDGKKFYNPQVKPRSFFTVIKWMLTRHPASWPTTFFNSLKQTHVNQREKECVVTFIGHSSFLIQVGNLNFLLDPIWSIRASPFSFMGPKRVQAPGLNYENLPPIDYVLISHNHYDHMDMPTLKKLEKDFHPVFYVSKGNQTFLEKKGFKRVCELDWWDTVSLTSIFDLSFIPAQHFSARGIFDRDLTLWGGFAIKGMDHLIYFAGDTGYGSHFKQFYKRLGSPTLSFLPIGAFEPRAIMEPVHMNPFDAVRAHQDLHSKLSIGMHFGTFQLTDEPIDAPVKLLEQVLKEKNIALENFQVLQPGESRIVKPANEL